MVLAALAIGVVVLRLLGNTALAGQETTQSLSEQLFTEAKAAKTLEDQNRVLQKIERLREGESVMR